MRAIGIVGYKNSGKTTLTHALARELTRRGHEVAVVKHTSHRLDLPGKDTAVLGEAAGQVGFISPQESGVFWKKPLSLENIMAYLEADVLCKRSGVLCKRSGVLCKRSGVLCKRSGVLLVEGFKAERTFPKIVCLRGEPEDQDLFDGLAIGAVGPVPDGIELDVPHLGLDEIGIIADLVEEKAFKLPNLDCGSCGFETCYEMAREIVQGNRSEEDCISLQPVTEVRIDGELMPMKPFISGIVRNTVLGMLSSLKGFKKGVIEIRIGQDAD